MARHSLGQIRSALAGALLSAALCAHAADKKNEPAKLPPPTAATLSDEHVVQAMERAIAFLLAQQDNKTGTWEHEKIETPFHKWPSYGGGVTALCTYALLHAGESLPEDPRLSWRSKELKPSIDALTKLNSPMNYVRSYQTAALAQLPATPENRALLKRVSDPLFAGYSPLGAQGYRNGRADEVAKGNWDTSNTQIALLAAWERATSGVEVANAFWQSQEKFWRTTQRPDGSWVYRIPKSDNRDSAHAMTAAALASLFILQEELGAAQTSLKAKPDKAIDGGLAWLDKNFEADTMLSNGETSFYFMYCLERVGLAAGRKTIHSIDWYRAGAAELIKQQRPNGSWEPADKWFDANSQCAVTSLALIFLARGRNPVAFNKLEYAGDTWNARPRDAANLTHWMARQFERAINWQSVPVTTPADNWADAPVLLITGSEDPKFTDDQIAKLKTYVNAGGLIFSVADGGTPAFTKAMQTYAAAITEKNYEMRDLPPEHPVFNVWGKIQKPVRMLGLSNGARELWMHAPADFAATWQRRAYASADEWTIPANVFFYAAGATKSLAPRLKSTAVFAPKDKPKLTFTLARLAYAGNSNPEPGAWPRFAKLMRRDASADIQLLDAKVESLNIQQARIAHLTGTAAFTISADGIKNLRTFLDAGGTLIIDNCGGGEPFHASVQILAKALFPNDTLAPLPDNDPLYTGEFPGGAKIDEVLYRKAALLQNRGLGRRPDISAVRLNNRPALLYAPEDLTSGLLGTNTLGIIGYTPDSALAVARNLVCAAAAPRPSAPPATSPAANRK